MSLTQDIRTVLASAGLVTVFPAANFTWFEQAEPDIQPADAIAIFYPYEGRAPMRTHDDFSAALRPRFQIVTRGDDGQDDPPKTLGAEIRDALDGIVDQFLASGKRYIVIRALGDVGFLKRDALNRGYFSANYEAEVAH